MKQEKDQSANNDRSPSPGANRSAPASGGSGGDKPKGTASPVQFPTLALPKGGGAIQGIGEKFQANPVTGTGSMSVPNAISPGRSGFAPQLALSYDSGAGNGAFGLGWDVGLPSISRKTQKGLPQYDGLPKYQDGADQDSDVFLLSGADESPGCSGKVSSQFRAGPEHYCILQPVIDTTIKNGQSIFDAIAAIVHLPSPPKAAAH